MAALHLSTVKPNAALFKTRQPPALKPCDFGEPLEHRVQAEGAEGAVAAAQPHQWNQLLLSSFLYFAIFLLPPWGSRCRCFSREGSWHRGKSQHMDPWWGARSLRKPTIADALLAPAGTALQGDEEESRLWGAASLLFCLRMGKGRTDFRNDCTGGS